VQRLDHVEIIDPVFLAPPKKSTAGPIIGFTRIRVTDCRRKEFKKTARRAVARATDHGRNYRASAAAQLAGSARSGDHFV
jgi:hypothetical protein